jgi:Bcr/CflA subfamily drug resistance transporter
MQTKPLYFYIILAGVFSAMAPVASDLYLPSLPSIATYFHAPITWVQLSVTTYMFGFALSRLVMATLSDFFGRRRPMLIALVICILGAFFCWQASSITMLLIGRLVQGFGAGGSNVLARVILRDTVSIKELPKYNSYNSMVSITLMASAPLLGGYIQHSFNWHLVFLILLIYACFACCLAWWVIPETNEHYHNTTFSLKNIIKNIRVLLSDVIYLKYGLIAFLSFGVLMAWLTAGAVLLQKVLLLNAVQYGWCAALVALGYFLGSFLNSRVVDIWGVKRMMRLGSWCVVVAGGLMLIPIMFFHWVSLWWIVLPCMFAFFGASLLFANTYASALAPYAKTAGIATAILGCIQLLGAVLTSSVISWAPDINQLPLALIIFGFGVILLFLLQKKQIRASCLNVYSKLRQ